MLVHILPRNACNLTKQLILKLHGQSSFNFFFWWIKLQNFVTYSENWQIGPLRINTTEHDNSKGNLVPGWRASRLPPWRSTNLSIYYLRPPFPVWFIPYPKRKKKKRKNPPYHWHIQYLTLWEKLTMLKQSNNAIIMKQMWIQGNWSYSNSSLKLLNNTLVSLK